jgi:hypothetical protein
LKEVAKVKVERWCPGVVDELIEESEHEVTRRKYDAKLSVEDRLLSEATEELEKKRHLHLGATKRKTCLLIENEGDQNGDMMSEVPENDFTMEGLRTNVPAQRTRRVRQKMLSAPIGVSDHFFGAAEPAFSDEDAKAAFESYRKQHKLMVGRDQFFAPKSGPASIQAELIIQGETFRMHVPKATLEQLRKGNNGEIFDNRGLSMSGITMTQEDTPVVNKLQGYVRSGQPTISDEFATV